MQTTTDLKKKYGLDKELNTYFIFDRTKISLEFKTKVARA